MSEQKNPTPEQEPSEEIVEIVAESVSEEDGAIVVDDVTVEEIVEDGEVVAEVVETVETVVAEDAETGDLVVEETVDEVVVVGDEVVAEVVEAKETIVAEDAETGEVVVEETVVNEVIVGGEVVAVEVSESVTVEDETAEDELAEGEVIIRKVEGPSTYTPQEFRGRVRRVGNDARLADIHYKNIPLLTRFLDPRGRILARRKIRVSAKVQRRAAKAIKRARHLALLPYTGEHTRITRKHR